MQLAIPSALVKTLPIVLPLGAVVIARLFTFTGWAAANTGWASIIFAWIVADALLLGLLAKAPNHKPTLYKVIGVLALASIVIIAGAAAPIREVYLGLPQVLIALGLTIAAFGAWSAFRFVQSWRDTGSVRVAAEQLLPPLLVHFVIEECRTLALGLFRWNAPIDAPEGTRAFAYHTYLTPMIATLVALQVIELSVVHFLVILWNPAVAWVLLAVSVWGVIWTVALLKSFRINPVLLTAGGVRVRSGMIHDFTVPYAQIEDWQKPLSAEELAQKSSLNLAILSSPNVSLRLTQPLPLPTMFGGTREISSVALRLDRSAEFVAALEASRDEGRSTTGAKS